MVPKKIPRTLNRVYAAATHRFPSSIATLHQVSGGCTKTTYTGLLDGAGDFAAQIWASPLVVNFADARMLVTYATARHLPPRLMNVAISGLP